jgi:hypothetical protein
MKLLVFVGWMISGKPVPTTGLKPAGGFYPQTHEANFIILAKVCHAPMRIP